MSTIPQAQSAPAVVRHAPQLLMHRRLQDLPSLELPAGFSARSYQPGDAAAWEHIIHHSFGMDAQGLFDRNMRIDPAYRPERVWFICRKQESGDQPVATASAWRQPFKRDVDTGTLHMVGVHPDHAGMGLGSLVSLAALHQMHREGKSAAVLQTDDHRLSAIKTYLKLGFEPLLIDENQRQRWVDVFETLNQSQLAQRFSAALTGPLHELPVPPDNLDRLDRYSPRKHWLPNREHRVRRTPGDFMADESLYHASRLGQGRVEPDQVIAGSPLQQPVRLIYTAGEAGVGQGSSITFEMTGQFTLGFRWQCNHPDAEGHCTITVPEGIAFTPLMAGLRIDRGHLTRGQEIIITLEKIQGLSWTPLAGRREFKVLIDPSHGEPRQRVVESAVIQVLPAPVARLEATLPCTRQSTSNETIITLTTRDAMDNRVESDSLVEVSLAGQTRVVGLQRGLAQVQFNDLPSDTVLRAQAKVKDTDLSCTSNVMVPTKNLHLYLGDLHVHDLLSESEGYCDEVYRWAMEDRRLDFLSVSSQSHGWHDNETWLLQKYMNERYNQPGKFVSLLGMEWQHSGFGDKVIHYLAGDQPYLPVDMPQYNHPAKLYEALRRSDALIISHHVGYPCGNWMSGTDYNVVETDVERLVELWSMQGSSEGHDPNDRPLRLRDENNMAYAVLRRGVRVGFVAGSDSHSARPGGSAREPMPYWGGLAAVWAPSLTRQDIYNALYHRHTYALTGARIVLMMTVNGSLMGSEIPASDHAEIHIEVTTPGTIARIELLKNTKVIHTFSPQGNRAILNHTDETDGPAFYHCRVVQTDGELAVCSPVWVG